MSVKSRRFPVLAVAALAVAVLLGVFSAQAFAASTPVWLHLDSTARPGTLPAEAGGKGYVVATATNLGDGVLDGSSTPLRLTDVLPQGLKAVSAKMYPHTFGVAIAPAFPCTVAASSRLVECSFAGTLPPYQPIEVRIAVTVEEGAKSGERNEFSVFGGGAPSAGVSRPVTIGEAPTPFGVETYELSPEDFGGEPDDRAGSHPYQLTTTIDFKQVLESHAVRPGETEPAGLTKDLVTKLPAGLIGNANLLPRCTLAQFETFKTGHAIVPNECPLGSIVGVASVTVTLGAGYGGTQLLTLPVYNLVPARGEPARFGFQPVVSVFLKTSLRSGAGEDYGVDITVPNTTTQVGVLSSTVTFWGTPGDARHDNSRGMECMAETAKSSSTHAPCEPLSEAQPTPFLTLPGSCSRSPLQTSLLISSWAEPERLVGPEPDPSEPMPTLVGCGLLPFAPIVAAEPSSDAASSPTGLDFNLDFHDEGLLSEEGLSQSQLKDTVVTLPEGLTINPSAGVGLGGCTPADYARETLSSLPGAGCPNDSKLGTVEVTTPLLASAIHGSLYIAQPYENPFSEPGHPNGSLVAIYVVLKDPETGVLIKLAGKVERGEPGVNNGLAPGQLRTTFENNPQLPFDHFNFHFREGQQAPLITPPACGTYTTQARLTPWSEPALALTDTSPFTIVKGFDGGACPSGGVPPFSPQITSGMLNNDAGSFSSFYLRLSRTDGEQEISGFSTNLPAGLTGELTGVPFCPEANIALARTKSGAQEEADPSCPAASQIGHTLVGTGVGAVLAYVPGKVYLAGPYRGAPFSLVSITSAVVGPFDLGTVVLRFGLSIDPTTAQVSVSPTSSEPIPTIIDGIVTHVRDIRVYIDRPSFMLNPTNCEPLGIGSTLSSDLGHSATVSSRFQATNCTALAFKPSFKVSTNGKTSRQNGASLHVRLAYPSAPQGTQANIRYVRVALPRQLPSNLKAIQQACPDHVFEADPAGCSAASRIGTAMTTTPILPVPLTGPVYFVSHAARAFPDIIAVLQGYGVTVHLTGHTFIAKNGQTTTTFETVPDAPVGVFEMDLPQGPFSALAAPTGVCDVTTTKVVKKKVTVRGKNGRKRTVTRRVRETVPAPLVMPTRMIAQNGAVFAQNTKIKTVGCPRANKKPSKRGKGKRKK